MNVRFDEMGQTLVSEVNSKVTIRAEGGERGREKGVESETSCCVKNPLEAEL